MINRRSFFKALGSTVLGTALVLRLSNSIVPTLDIVEDKLFQFSYEYLNNLWEQAKKSTNGKEPDVFIIESTKDGLNDHFYYHYNKAKNTTINWSN